MMWKEMFSVLPWLMIIVALLVIGCACFIEQVVFALKDSLKDNKILCHHCGKLHQKDFEFAGIPFCSCKCCEEFAASISTEELLRLNDIDMTINKYK